MTVVLSAKDKFRKIGRELQLPSMQPLTTKTSRQVSYITNGFSPRKISMLARLLNLSKSLLIYFSSLIVSFLRDSVRVFDEYF